MATDLSVADKVGAPALGMQAALNAHKRDRLDQLMREYNNALVAIRNDPRLSLEELRARERAVTAQYDEEVRAIDDLRVSDPKVGMVKRFISEAAGAVGVTLKKWVARLPAIAANSPLTTVPAPSPHPLAPPVAQPPPAQAAWGAEESTENEQVLFLSAGERKCFSFPTCFRWNGNPFLFFMQDTGERIPVGPSGVDLVNKRGDYCYEGGLEGNTIRVWRRGPKGCPVT